MPRFLTLVIDSGGIGALPDAAEYGDAPGANTMANVAARLGGLRMPNFERLGLGNLTDITGVPAAPSPAAAVARLQERSKGKDTITGHWEMAGIHTSVAFPTYPTGFPPEVIKKFAAITGKSPLGNKPASGTEIIEELGAEHMRSGRPILYTSADSVFQVAAHEAIVSLQALYEWCEEAREMLVAPHAVNRVIARPFAGEPGRFLRTSNRRDYAIAPPPNLLDRLAAARIPVHAVGKISDIYCGRGVESSVRVADNQEAVNKTLELMERTEHGLIFVNLNDFDSKYGHRRDVRGYGDALETLDASIPDILKTLRPGDQALFTADHGCDPTAPGSDHTREFAPYIHVGGRKRGALGVLQGFDAVALAVESALFNEREGAQIA